MSILKSFKIDVYFFIGIVFLFGLSCNRIEDSKISFPPYNTSRIELDVALEKAGRIVVDFYEVGKPQTTQKIISEKNVDHQIYLLGLKPETKYNVDVSLKGQLIKKGKGYQVDTKSLPPWFDTFNDNSDQESIDTNALLGGYIFLTRKEDPGIFLIIDGNQDICWYQQLMNKQVKLVNRCGENSFIAILGGKETETVYGDEIVEFNLNWKKVTYLKRGDKDFQSLIHHEVFKNTKGDIVTLTQEPKVVDLSSVGGLKNDTVVVDGILVMDGLGNKIWSWTVLDVMNPINSPNILEEKVDWLHANALSLDNDDNYLLSLFKPSQIWKINSQTGELIWKLGRNGDFEMDTSMIFCNQHSVHINKDGHLMIFDNGNEKGISRALSFAIDEDNMTATKVIDVSLPVRYFSKRRGSAYLLDNNDILFCSSEGGRVGVYGLDGNVKWHFKPFENTYRSFYLEPDLFKRAMEQ